MRALGCFQKVKQSLTHVEPYSFRCVVTSLGLIHSICYKLKTHNLPFFNSFSFKLHHQVQLFKIRSCVAISSTAIKIQ